VSRIRQVVFELPPAFFADQGSLPESEELLQAMLDLMVRANLMHLKSDGRSPSLRDARDAGLRWSAPEGARLSSIPAVLARGRAACASLSCYRAAELVHSGADVGARPTFTKRVVSAENRVVYHVLVRRSGGAVEDPSAFCGMPRGGEGG
jgi:hypothetical protein